METNEKTQIAEELSKYCARMGSQNKAAASLTGVSAATISQMLNKNWELITPEMWRNVAAQISKPKNWNIAPTRVFNTITKLLEDAKEHSNVYAITGPAGCGKTAALESFKQEYPNVFLVKCGDYWNKRHFLSELLRVMGREVMVANIGEMMQEAVAVCKKTEKPVIILDEVDKLADPLLYFFITLYNELQDVCGIVMLSTEFLEKRINRGLRLGKKGYREIYSRIGGQFIKLGAPDAYDVRMICEHNRITKSTDIDRISKECGGDLRIVKRKAHAVELKEAGK